jgi:two-component sensor histidine kinase
MQDFNDQVPAAGGSISRAGDDPLRERSAETNAVLREVDHRVKNNLQLVASLILLQSRRTEDTAARQALKTVLERVNAVATVHRRLFEGDLQRFDVAEFVRDLVGDLAAAAGRGDIEIALDLDHVQIPAASSAAFALVANELIGNAMRHAFPPGQAGRISVSLAEQAGRCVLTVADDGVGLSDAPPGFGLTIVRLLCQQLHADLDPPAGATGTRFVLRVPLERAIAS